DVDCALPPSAAAPAHPEATECAPKNTPVKIINPPSKTQISSTKVSSTPIIMIKVNTISTLDGQYCVAIAPAHGDITVRIKYSKNRSDTIETGMLKCSSTRWKSKKL